MANSLSYWGTMPAPMGADGEQRRSPAGEDVGAEQCDGEEDAAADVGESGEHDGCVHPADLARCRPVVGDRDGVADPCG
jgi:hypothetical protein